MAKFQTEAQLYFYVTQAMGRIGRSNSRLADQVNNKFGLIYSRSTLHGKDFMYVENYI